jgi:hypothetical protein
LSGAVLIASPAVLAIGVAVGCAPAASLRIAASSEPASGAAAGRSVQRAHSDTTWAIDSSWKTPLASL